MSSGLNKCVHVKIATWSIQVESKIPNKKETHPQELNQHEHSPNNLRIQLQPHPEAKATRQGYKNKQELKFMDCRSLTTAIEENPVERHNKTNKFGSIEEDGEEFECTYC